MYSMVLMMALNSGAAAPAGLFSHGCDGCCGGYNACCGGSACNGCCGGWSCNGCCGGHGHFSLFNHGCCGGWSNHGCCGGWSGHGCCGGHVASYNCCGGNACCGGNGCCGGYSCHGGLFHGGLFHGSCHGCYGCNGCSSCAGCAGCTEAAPAAPAPKSEPVPAPKKTEKKADAGDAAKVIVTLPADAKLFIDGEATTSTSGVRTFVTPTLDAGEEYFYNLKAEINRDGKTFVVTQRVTVRAGEETTADLQFPMTASN